MTDYATFLDAKLHHRGADGFELKPSYFRQAVMNLQMLDHGYEQETWLTAAEAIG